MISREADGCGTQKKQSERELLKLIVERYDAARLPYLTKREQLKFRALLAQTIITAKEYLAVK